jgi:hypothetical protein
MPPRRTASPILRPQRQLRDITVTRFSTAGTVPKHAEGRFFPDNLVWETSMPLGKRFFRGRLPFVHVPHVHVPHAHVPRAHVSPDTAANADAARARQLQPLRICP